MKRTKPLNSGKKPTGKIKFEVWALPEHKEQVRQYAKELYLESKKS